MKTTSRHPRLSTLARCALACAPGLLAMACSGHDGPAAPAPQEVVTLQLQVSAPSAASSGKSRAADATGLAEENYIGFFDGLSDYRFYLFAGDGEHAPLMQQLAAADVQAASDEYDRYTLRFHLPKSILPHIAPGGATATFTIACLANWDSLGNRSASATNAYPTLAEGSSTISTLQNAWHLFTMPSDYGDGEAWMPDGEANRMPMYGLQSFSVPLSYLEQSTPTVPLDLYLNTSREISMVRAMAKLEVADNMLREPGNAYPRLGRVAVANWNTQGRMNLGSSYIPGEQPATEESYPSASTAQIVMRQAASTNTCPEWEGLDVRRCYLPEINLKSTPTTLEVEVFYGPAAAHTYSLPLADRYADWRNQIVRNHIYRIEVTGGAATNLEFNFTTCPWDGDYTIDVPPFE